MPGDCPRGCPQEQHFLWHLSRDHFEEPGGEMPKKETIPRNNAIAIWPPFFCRGFHILEGNLNLLLHFLTVDVVPGIRAWNPRFFICEKRAPI